MRHLVEVTWTRGDVDVLNRYFGNTVSPDKGKPTNGEFVARITNIVKLRMKEAA
jgi:two-component system response regulator (stage 0 sporulation protein A)